MDTRQLMLMFAVILGSMAITGMFVVIVNIVLNWIKKG